MPKLSLQCWGAQVGRGGTPVLLGFWDSPGQEAAAVGRAARCRGTGAAGQGVCILLTHWELLPWVGKG